MRNLFKEKIAAGAKPIGMFVDTGSPYVVECLGRTGLDYVIIDNEHSPIEAETSANLIRCAENTGMTPICRVRESSRPAILKLLDVGAQGIIVPDVKSVEQVKDLISFAKYAPIGNRGFCPSRNDGWGYDEEMSIADTMAYYNERTLLIPQCETKEALECIEEIVALEGVDGIFIGPFDLSISLGMPGDFTNPVFVAALKRIVDACRAAGKFTILFTMTAAGVVDGFNNKGVDSMTYSFDAKEIIESIKGLVSGMRSKID